MTNSWKEVADCISEDVAVPCFNNSSEYGISATFSVILFIAISRDESVLQLVVRPKIKSALISLFSLKSSYPILEYSRRNRTDFTDKPIDVFQASISLDSMSELLKTEAFLWPKNRGNMTVSDITSLREIKINTERETYKNVTSTRATIRCLYLCRIT